MPRRANSPHNPFTQIDVMPIMRNLACCGGGLCHATTRQDRNRSAKGWGTLSAATVLMMVSKTGEVACVMLARRVSRVQPSLPGAAKRASWVATVALKVEKWIQSGRRHWSSTGMGSGGRDSFCKSSGSTTSTVAAFAADIFLTARAGAWEAIFSISRHGISVVVVVVVGTCRSMSWAACQ